MRASGFKLKMARAECNILMIERGWENSEIL